MSFPTRTIFTLVALAAVTLIGFFVMKGSGEDVAEAEWFNDEWHYRVRFTVDSSKVDADLTDFPLLVHVSSTVITFSNAQASGQDIRFTDKHGALLKYEIERWDNTNSLADVWVKLPTVHSSTDTIFYMYYANPSAKDAQTPTEVWDENHVGVWHLNENATDEATSTTHTDSTINVNNGTQQGNASTTGKIANAQNFDGTDDYVSVNSDTSLDLDGSSYTLSVWVNFDSTGGSQGFISKRGASVADQWLHFAIDSVNNLTLAHYTDDLDVSFTKTTGRWYHIVGRYDTDSNEQRIFVDGVSIGSRTATADLTSTNGNTIRIGRLHTDIWELDGKLDDVRIYNYARTQKQILEDMNAGHPAVGSPVGSYVGYWDFDEGYGANAFDKSIHKNAGTITVGGSGTNTTLAHMWDPSGKFGSALEFDGTDDYVERDAQLVSAYPFTLSTWFKTDVTSGNYGMVGFFDNSASNVHYSIEFNTDTVRIKARNTTTYAAKSPNPFNDNSWHHAVGVFSSATDRKLYVDGVEEATDTVSVTYNSNVDRISIGRLGDSSPSAYFNGLIDEVVIYPFALTADEVGLEFNRRSGLVWGSLSTETDGVTASNSAARAYCVPGDTSTCNAPVLHIKMDEQFGVTTYDTSGNGNDGTASGGPLWKRAGSCRLGSCLDFDGVDDYVDVIHFARPSSHTISAWIKHPATSSTREIFGWGATGGGGNTAEFRLNNTGVLQYGEYDGTWVNVVSSVEVDDDTWHFVTVTKNGDTITLYIDGSQDGSGTISKTITTLYIAIGLLNRDTVKQFYFDGTIDDVRIYNYALTQKQIDTVYNQGSGVRFGPETGTP